MELFEAISSRYSYRGDFLPTKVPREDLEKIMIAGLQAPSGCNKQTTSLIAVDDRAVLDRINILLEHKCDTAPAAICVLTEKIIAYRDRTYYLQDYSAAIENMLLAVTAMGYATCWLEGYITDADKIGRRIADLLGVPSHIDLVCYLPIGIPAADGPRALKRPFGERMQFNGYAIR